MNEHGSRFGGSGGDRIDRAIDRAVRDMMWTDPPAGLRRRVLSRLEAAPRRESLLPRFAFAAAALAVLVTGAVLMRDGGGTTAPPQSTIAVAPSVEAARPAPAVSAPVHVASSGQPATRRLMSRGDGRIRMPAIANVFGPSDGRVSGANVADPGIAGAPSLPSFEQEGTEAASPLASGLPALQTEQLTIAPLEVKPLQVAPLPLRK